MDGQLSSFLGFICFCCHLQTKTTVTRRHGIRVRGHDGKDIFRLFRAAVRPRWFKPSLPNMGSVYQVQVKTSSLSGPYPQGTRYCCTIRLGVVEAATGSQVEGSIQLVMVALRLGFV